MTDRRHVFERKQTKPVTLEDMPKEVTKVVVRMQDRILVAWRSEYGNWLYGDGNHVVNISHRVAYILEPEPRRVEQPESQVGKTMAEAEPGMYLVQACGPHDHAGQAPILACKPHYGDTVLAGKTSEGRLRVTTSAENLTLGRILAEYDPPRWDTEGGAE